MSELPTWAPSSTEERTAALEAHVADRVRRFDARVFPVTPTSVVLVYGRRPNHLLHLALTVVTGVWGIVWLGLAISGGERRKVATVDAWGRVEER